MLTDEMRAQVEPTLRAALRYAPVWLQSMNVRWDSDVGGLLCINAQPEYRCANIRVGDQWFSEGEGERRIAFVHEILHTQVQCLAVVLDDLIDATDPAEPLRKWAKEQWRRAEEGMICDLSRRIVGAHG
jgi:hypothetical protein